VLQGDGSHLADYELLEMLLCAFIPRVDVKPIAKNRLGCFGAVSAALAAPPERLMEIPGIGESAAAYIRMTNLLMQLAAADAGHLQLGGAAQLCEPQDPPQEYRADARALSRPHEQADRR
jgi:DNA repair protein RadC